MVKSKKVKALLLSITALSVLGTSSCGISRQELVARAAQGAITASVAYLTPISAAQENQIGVQSVTEVFKEFREYTANAELVNYVRSVGDKVISQASRKNELNYKLYVLDSPIVNAFTIPGGAIFITTESLKYMKDESELVGVLSHELGHNENKHPVETIKRSLAVQGLAQGALSSTDPAVLQIVAQVSLDLILKGFSRAQEKEADETGAVILSKLSYDTDGLSGFLRSLLTISADPKGLIKLFSTHPGSQDRIDSLNKYITNKNISNPSGTTNQETFARYISVLPAKVSLQN